MSSAAPQASEIGLCQNTLARHPKDTFCHEVCVMYLTDLVGQNSAGSRPPFWGGNATVLWVTNWENYIFQTVCMSDLGV